MSIQLDGRVTYPYERDDEEEREESGSREEPSLGNSITWDGFWYYSQKQPKGGNDLCGFNYYFAGPADINDPSLAPNPASPESAYERPRQTKLGSSVSSGRSRGATFATPGQRSTDSPAKVERCVTQIANSAERSSDIGNKIPLTQQLAMYGPRGDGRLPSGKWKGHFIVKYSKNHDVKVEETFVLEFGSKSQRRSATPPPGVGSSSTVSNGNQRTGPASAAGSESSSGGEIAATREEVAANPATNEPPSVAVPTGTSTLSLSSATAAPAEVSVAVATVETTTTMTADQASASVTQPASAQTPQAPTMTPTSTAIMPASVTESSFVPPAPIAPVVRVSGWGENKYGQFTLMGGHERATGRLDLTRFYYEKPKQSGRTSGDRGGGSGSHQKKKKSHSSSLMLQSPGPSIAERRTKRTRHPNQRLLDDEGLVSHCTQAESLTNSGGVGDDGGSGGGGAGPGMMKRKSSSEIHTVAASSSAEAGGGNNEATAVGSSAPRTRKPRDREHELFMERARRAKRKEAEAKKVAGAGMNYSGGILDTRGGAAVCVGPMSVSEKAAAESLARVEEQREVLAALESAETDDPVFEQLHRDTIATMKERLTALEAEATTAAAEARGMMPTSETTLEHNDSWGSSGGAGSKRGSTSSRSRRVAVERWEEMTFDPETQECYEGGWLRGRRHGKGICVYAHRRIYEGDWRAGKEHGWGKIMEEDRRTLYEGELADGKLYGKGRYTSGSGAVYDGEWKDNAMHGRGVYTFPASLQGESMRGTMVYDGEFRDNARCGRGVQTWPGGSYDGEWLDNARHGRGILSTDDGFVYDGQWVDDLPEGRGICIHPDGQRYEGVFRGGKKEGRGTLAFANGASYEGRFRDDAIDGQGMLHIPKPVEDNMGGWMIPIQFQSDIERIHVKAGFDKVGL